MVVINTYKGHEIIYTNEKFTTMGLDYVSEKDCLNAIDLAMKEQETKEKIEKEQKEKERLTNGFRIVLAEPSYLVQPIKNMKELMNEVKMKITPEKLTITSMDPANVTMVVYELLSESAVEWKCEEADVYVNLSNFYSVLKNCEKNDILVFERATGKKNVILSFKGAITKEFTIPFLDLEEREIKIPKLKFSSKTIMRTSDFKKVVTFANEVAKSIKIETWDAKILFSAKDDESEFNCSILDSKEVGTLGESTSKYSIEYLKRFPLTSIEMIQLEGGKDYPLKVYMRQIDRFSLTYFLAPRVDNE